MGHIGAPVLGGDNSRSLARLAILHLRGLPPSRPQRNIISFAMRLSEHHEVLRQFYKRESITHLTERVHVLSKEMNLIPSKLSFREPKGRWGSCSSKGSINLNWRLILFKPEVVDYVIIHELCHLQHLNHSNAFWSLVGKHCPNYQTSEHELKHNQMLTQFLDR